MHLTFSTMFEKMYYFNIHFHNFFLILIWKYFLIILKYSITSEIRSKFIN